MTLLLAAPPPAVGQPGDGAPPSRPTEGDRAPEPVSDLTPLNFFTEGWSEPWTHRHGRTPDMALIHATTNFLERELRLDFARTELRDNPRFGASDLANALIAYGVNRRLMFAVVTNYQWNEAYHGVGTNGAGGGAVIRLQLADTPGASLAFQVRGSPANRGVGQTQTSYSYALAGWQDLAALLPALDRVGLYYSVQYEHLDGQTRPGVRQNDLSLDVSVARTWTEPSTAIFGNLTTFVELFGATDLDGETSGDTALGVMPGVRFWFARDQSLMGGVDLPLSHEAPFSAVYRVTYILNF